MVPSHNEFIKHQLNLEDLQPDPYMQFSNWLDDYIQFGDSDNVAMSVSTIDKEGFPTSRIVYMRDFDSSGMVFFTNYDSNKGKELEKNNRASLLFYWPDLERQIRIWGSVEKVEATLSDAYFKERPKNSQAGAWISEQSKEIDKRDSLEKMHKAYLRKMSNKVIPRPDFWGGFRLIPCGYEFWQGRESRLHDRFLYTQEAENWVVKRLAP